MPPFGTDSSSLGSRAADRRCRRPASGPRRRVAAAADRLVLSRAPRAGRPGAPPVRAAAPVVLNGRIDPAGDEDRFVLAVTPGQKLRIGVEAYELGSALDGVLQVEGKGGSSSPNADDTTIPLPPKNGAAAIALLPDPSLDFTVPGGTTEITLAIRDLERAAASASRTGSWSSRRSRVRARARTNPGEHPEGRNGRGRRDGHAQGIQRTDHADGPQPARRADGPPGHDRRGPDGRRGDALGRRRCRVPRRADQADRPGTGAERPDRRHRRQDEWSSPSKRTCRRAPSPSTAWSRPRPADARHARRAVAPIEVAHGFGATIPVKVALARGPTARSRSRRSSCRPD